MEWASDIITDPVMNSTIQTVCEQCQECSSFTDILGKAISMFGAVAMMYIFFK